MALKRAHDGPSGGGGKRPASGLHRASMPPVGPMMPGQGRLTTSDALSYLRNVKVKFQDRKDIYDTFLEIMKEFKAQRINTEGVIERVKELFAGHRELILGFNTFLPKGYEITLPPEEERKTAVEFDQAINYVNKIKTRFANDERVYKAFLEILNMYRKGQKNITNVYEEVAGLFRRHDDLLQEFTYFLPDSTAPAAQHQARLARQGRGGAPMLMRHPQAHSRTASDVPMTEAQVVRKMNQRKSARKAEDSIRRQAAGEEGEDMRGPRGHLAREMGFFERVKKRLADKVQYQDFLKCLNLFAQDICSRNELSAAIHDVLGRFPDLTNGFHEFIARCEASDMSGAAMFGKATLKDIQKMKGADLSQRYLLKPISELDHAGWERSTPSYVKLPKEYPKIRADGRTALGKSLLNDMWCSVTFGSEDYSFKHMRKNQYEEALFRCEDDRFDLDMHIETNASAKAALQPINLALMHMEAEDRANFRIEDSPLRAIHYTAIKRVYGERGAEIVDLLKQNPGVAVPVVLSRLEQKHEEWKKERERMNKIWSRVFDNNYHKSLDHRSFYFKQTDKRNLGTKAMLAEIRELGEKFKVQDDVPEALGATYPFSARLRPFLTLDCTDRDVHNDVYKVIKHWVGTTDSADKLLDIWTSFVETFFGLPQRPKEEQAGQVEETSVEDLAKATLGNLHAAAMSENGGGDSEQPSRSHALTDALGTEAGSGLTGRTGPIIKGGEDGDPMDTEAGDSDLDQEEEGENAQQEANQGDPSRIMYGNEAFFVFFRLHHHLYDRLRKARECAQARAAQTFLERRQQQAIEQTLDTSQFEDSCRALLGTNSYVLFTLEKLVARLMKHLQTMLSEDVSCKLFDLWKYESARGAGYTDAVNYANAHVILHDDTCFRFESRADDKLTIQQLFVDKSEVAGGIVPAGFSEYLRTFTEMPAGARAVDTSGRTALPYLPRTLPHMTPATMEEQSAILLATAMLHNGLECKVATTTSKVSYVLNTEDVFLRKQRQKKRPSSAALKAKADRMLHWMSQRFRANITHGRPSNIRM
ncbi:hypothetical protein WJX84_003538 [Apatococcus fuscideae]|uniref:Histone deacetylase interacting domain-containing protein n=1 Tax=Apatococcus fuscideae TaxID=2026836 RepID=A0AAW1TA41_9CHLO